MRKITLSGTPQQKFDQIALELNNLSNSVNAKEQSSGRGFTGKEGDIQIIEDVEKNKLFGINTKGGWYVAFAECFQSYKPGEIPRLRLNSLEVDNLFAKMFTINQTQAVNGNQIMGAGSGVVEAIIDNTKIRIKDQTGLGVCGFAVNDKCEIRQVNPSSLADIRLVQFTVDAVSGQEITVTYTGANRPLKGDTIFVKGNSGTASRQNSIYFSTVDTNSPYIDLYTGTTSFTFGTTVARIGNLTGITDADFGGALSGYGIYTTNAYFKGKISLANNGSISLGKTAYNDTTNAGFWLGDSDATATINPYFYLGSASDAKYLKVDTVAGTFQTLGFTITGGVVQTSSGTTTKVIMDGSTNLLKVIGNNADTFIGLSSSATPYMYFDIAGSGTVGQISSVSVATSHGVTALGLQVSNTGNFKVGATLEIVTGIYMDDNKFQLDNTGKLTYMWSKVVDSPTTGVLNYNGTKFVWTSVSNWDAAYNDKINSASFNTGDGVLTLTQQDTGTVTVDLDGRYLTSLSGAVLTSTDQTIAGTKTFSGELITTGTAVRFKDYYAFFGDAGAIAGNILLYTGAANNYNTSLTGTAAGSDKFITLPNADGMIALKEQITIGGAGTSTAYVAASSGGSPTTQLNKRLITIPDGTSFYALVAP